MSWLQGILASRATSSQSKAVGPELDQDLRWHRLHGHGTALNGVVDINFEHPDTWMHGLPQSRHEQSELTVGSDHLGPDICVHDGQHYVRCVLMFPIIGSDQNFGFGCWGSVSEATFHDYLNETQNSVPFEGAFSWLSNALPSFPLAKDPPFWPCRISSLGPEKRPQLRVQKGPIADAQTSGITFDRLLDIYDASGNDIRSQLTD